MGVELDTDLFKIGNGVTAWNELAYSQRGPKGDKGDTGPAGAPSIVPGSQGLKGDKGDPGAESTVPGPQGPVGPREIPAQTQISRGQRETPALPAIHLSRG